MKMLTKVADLMATRLVTVTVHTPVNEAMELMRKHEVHHLPVVDPTGGLEGMISRSDFAKLIRTSDGRLAVKGDPNKMTARDIMTPRLAKLEPSDTVRTAASLFSLNRFHALPVVDDGRLVGILTTLDLIKLMDKEVVGLDDYKQS